MVKREQHKTARRCSPTALLAVCIVASSFASAGEQRDMVEPVVPSGQNTLLSAMLGRGATLPDDCTFASGRADGPVIRATYACPFGDVEYELVHPENADAGTTQTEHFALAPQSGSPPEELTDALAGLIRSREGEFRWLWLTDEDDGHDGEPHSRQNAPF